MAFDLSAASNVLKVRYLGPIREQLNGATVLLSRIQRAEDYVLSGKTWTVPLHTGRNASAGTGRADGGALPTAGQQSYEVAVVPNAYQYGRIQVSGPTVRAARDNAGAFVRAIESEIDGLTRDMKKAFNRQLHSDGTDALAYWTGADDTTTTLVDDNRGNSFVHLPASGTMSLDLIDASDNATALNGNTAIVVTLGAATSTGYVISWTGTVTGSADTDYLVMQGTLGYQMMGIAGIVDDGNPTLLSGGLHGLPVATKAFWKAQVVEGDTAGTNQALTLPRMQAVLSRIATNSDFSDSDIKFILASYGVRDKYVDLLISEKRFVNTMTLDGGFKGVDFNGIPLVPDPQCRKNRMYFINPDSMRIFRSSDFDWMDKDGAVLARVAGYDAYEAVLFHYGNLGCLFRNANGLLDDISE
jgi:hypothetical protein